MIIFSIFAHSIYQKYDLNYNMKKIEHNIIDGLKNGDREIFNRIFYLFYSDLVNYCGRFVNDDDVAEEIVQDIFTKLWIRHSYININSSLKAYLYKAVRNHTLNYFKYIKQKEKYKQYIGLSTIEKTDTPLNKLEEKNIQIRIDEAMLMLPEKCRKVFELKRYERLKNKEIAEKLNISIKTVENHISKAIKLLKKALKYYLL